MDQIMDLINEIMKWVRDFLESAGLGHVLDDLL